MTCRITYNTDCAPPLCTGLRWWNDLQMRARFTKHGLPFNTPICSQDYALESPNEMPAGGCEQDVIVMEHNEYDVCAAQMVVMRDGGA